MDLDMILKTKAKRREERAANKDRPPRQTKNAFNVWTIIGLTAFFVIMFTSRYFLKPTNLAYDVGTTQVNGVNYTAVSWTWDKDKKEMEVIVSVGGQYAKYQSANATMEIVTSTSTERKNCEIKYLSNDTVVVLLNNVPKDTYQAKMNLSLEAINNSYFVQFANNRDKMIIGEITDLTENEYRIKSKEGEITRYNELIEANDSQINANTERMVDLDGQIKEVQSQMAYMTATQITKAQTDIDSYRNQKKMLAQENVNLDKESTEWKSRITFLEKQVKDIEGEK